MKCFIFGAVFSLAVLAGADAASLTVPFDFSRSAIGLDVTVKGVPLHMILDTGVDPLRHRPETRPGAGAKIDHGAGGQASGEGDASNSKAYPTAIDDLKLSGRAFPAFEALAFDMSALSARYGRPLDGVLGYSFLTDKIVLIDYPKDYPRHSRSAWRCLGGGEDLPQALFDSPEILR